MKAIPATIRRFPLVVALVTAALVIVSAVALAAEEGFFSVRPRTYDPLHTRLVNSSWQVGIGCPTNAKTATADPTDPTGNRLIPGPNWTDPACGPLLPTDVLPSLAGGDRRDKNNEGLLMAKTGATANYAAAVADIVGVKGMVITELGYDIRKAGLSVDQRGSHCGAGAPRFDVTLENGQSFFIGCNSPPPTLQKPGVGWLRLRWGGAVPVPAYNAATGVLESLPVGVAVKSLQIVFDEGQDTPGDMFGMAVLDNIDVNGVMVGRGTSPSDNGGDNGNGGGNGGGNNN